MPDLDRLAPSRRDLLAAAIVASFVPLPAGATVTTARPAGAAGFDFLHGRWTVRHRKLKDRLAGSTEWIEFAGTLDVKPMLGGLGNIDENELEDPAGRHLATSIRVFNPASGEWSIYWADGRRAGLDKPVVGRFEGKVGHFYNDDELGGRRIRVRFTYEDLAPMHAHWSQAFSADGGASWEVNWTMDFARETGR